MTVSGEGGRIDSMGSVVKLHEKSAQARRRRWSLKRLVHGIQLAWTQFLVSLTIHFPPDSPQPSPPLAKAEALREGALLSEDVDARSKKSIA